ncbi:MAG: hypothetical protein KJO21_12455 [Verrucomicrobiae bacterium]|nr:hypothetical protein [Verrucomicrobiae bacterium]NNJ44030.1 hypothetical protein [Akkermansiaceae bacterium]
MNIILNTLRPAVTAAALGVAFLVGSGVAQAGPPSAVTQAKTAATILVSVPANGAPVTYMVGRKSWTVQPGQTMVLPAAATKISLPVGTIITSSVPSAKSMDPTKQTYTVNKPIYLAALTPDSIRSNSSAFTPGNDPSIAGNIQHQSRAVKQLIEAVTSASGSTVNPLNVLGDAVTDGNAQ